MSTCIESCRFSGFHSLREAGCRAETGLVRQPREVATVSIEWSTTGDCPLHIAGGEA